MITLDVAAASAALEAKVITDLRDEIAKAMARANDDINAQSEEFSKLFNARCKYSFCFHHLSSS